MLSRAFSVLDIKAVDDDQRIVEGVATSLAVDRMGDIVEPNGAEFKLPIPFLWQHNAREPIGEVFAAKVTAEGIVIKARIAKIDEPGKLKDRLDEAWQSIKNQLVRGLSIGFSSIEHTHIDGTFGIRFIKWLWLELSAVTIPANGDASITAIKSLARESLAKSGINGSSRSSASPLKVPSTPVVRLLPSRQEQAMKSLQEQITGYKSTRDAKFQEQQGLMTKAAEAGVTLDDEESTRYDTLDAEIKALDVHIKRLEESQKAQAAAATAPAGTTQAVASVTRGGGAVSTSEPKLPQGIGLARFVLASINARKNGCTVMEFAKQRWPDDQRLHTYVQRATVPAGLTTDANWAGNLVDPTNLASEFIEFLRPRTIIGRIPGLRRVPFNIRVTGQSTGAVANWVGQGKPKPVTSFSTSATTLLYTKIAAIAVITQELARFSDPSAEALVRDELARAVIERMDIDFIDPAQAAVANVSPASITNGVTPLSPSGTTADAARTDLTNLLSTFVENNLDPSNLVLIMPNSLALALSLMVNSLGQPSFPGLTMTGGTLLGIPVVASQYAANASGSGNLVIALDSSSIFLADDGQVTLDASGEASIQMSDAPTNDAATGTGQSLVSMYQTNAIAIRAERFINWAKVRTTAVQFIDDVNWGSVGSPA
jgi:HK97 family phage major capsid protein/HK97 family phage prohead protease